MLVQRIDQTVITVIIGVLAVIVLAIVMLVLQVDQAIIIALIGVIGGVFPVGISYVLTKNKEIDANIRQEKTKRYDELIDALTVIVRDGFETFASDRKLMINLITTYNRASAYASDLVLEKCNDLLNEILEGAGTGKLTSDAGNKLIYIINDIYTAIRRDINPRARNFKVVTLWTEPKKGTN